MSVIVSGLVIAIHWTLVHESDLSRELARILQNANDKRDTDFDYYYVVFGFVHATLRGTELWLVVTSQRRKRVLLEVRILPSDSQKSCYRYDEETMVNLRMEYDIFKHAWSRHGEA